MRNGKTETQYYKNAEMNRKQLGKNSIYNIFGTVVPMLIIVLTTPFYVKMLGVTGYGVWTLSSSLLGFVGILNLGFGDAILKFIPEYRTLNKVDALLKLLLTISYVYTIVGILGVLVLFLLADTFVLNVFKIVPDAVEPAKQIFKINALLILPTLLRVFYVSIPKAFHKFKYSMVLNVFFYIIFYIGSGVVLYLTKDLLFFLGANVLASFLSLIPGYYYTKKLIPEYTVIPRFDFDTFKKIFHFGSYTMITSIAGILILYTGNTLVGMLLGATAVTFYSIPFKFSKQLMTIPGMISQVFTPIASELNTRNKSDELARTFVNASVLNAILTLGMGAVVFTVAQDILTIWMGYEYALKTYKLLQILIIIFTISSLNVMNFQFLNGLGRPDINAAYISISVVLIVALTILLTPKWGVIGAGVSMTGYWFVLFSFTPTSSMLLDKTVFSRIIGIYGAPLLAFIVTILSFFVFKFNLDFCHSMVSLAIKGTFFLILYCGSTVILYGLNRIYFYPLFTIKKNL